MTSDRKHALKRAAAHAGAGLVVFVVSLVLAFPYERAKDRIIALLAAQNLDAEIRGAGPTLGIGLRLDEIVIRTRVIPPARPTRLIVDRARVLVSALGALLGRPGVRVEADLLGGHLSYARRVTRTDVLLVIAVANLDIAGLPGVKQAINLPLSGKLGFSSDLKLPMGHLSEGAGAIAWKCAECAIGDGKEKLKIAGNPLLAEGLTLPRVRLGDFEGRINVEKGTGKLLGVHAKSPDGEVIIEGEVSLRDPPGASVVRLYLQFKVSDVLVKSSDKLQLLLQLAEANGKRPDGFYGVMLTGHLDSLDPPLWSKTSPFAGTTPTGRPLPRINPLRPGVATAPPVAPLPQAPAPAAPAAEPSPSPPSITPVTPPPAPAPAVDDQPMRATPVPASPPMPAALGESLRHTMQALPAEQAARHAVEKAQAGQEKKSEEETEDE